MRIEWRAEAAEDRREAIAFLRQRNPTAALRIASAVRHWVAMLSKQPHLGRAGRVPDTRELLIPQSPYIVIYTVDAARDTVVILRMLHGARRWPVVEDDEPAP